MGGLNDLSASALSAAMRGGTAEWGERANALEHVRYAEPLPEVQRRGGRTFYPTRCKCRCGCGGRKRFLGMANGICLMSGCELSVRRWVRDPLSGWRSPTAESGADSPSGNAVSASAPATDEIKTPSKGEGR